MLCIITGHTTGLGKCLYTHFEKLGHTVVGISRTTGYNLETDIDRVIADSIGCDLFINNAYINDAQIKLAKSLHNKVGKMVVMGSIAGDYHNQMNNNYSFIKSELSKVCKILSGIPETKILHLKISMLEDAISTENPIKYQEVINTIDFWLTSPRISEISFDLKLTPFTRYGIKKNLNLTV
jgi:hypothetical protein